VFDDVELLQHRFKRCIKTDQSAGVNAFHVGILPDEAPSLSEGDLQTSVTAWSPGREPTRKFSISPAARRNAGVIVWLRSGMIVSAGRESNSSGRSCLVANEVMG